MIKLISKILVVILIPLSLCSCEFAGTELSDLLIIQGIGIDFENNQFKITVEALNNEHSGSPAGSSGNSKTRIYTSLGETVAEALRNLSKKSGNSPLFSHNRVIILGESVLNKKLSNTLDFFVRNYDSRVSQQVCVAKKGSAEKILRAKMPNDVVKSELLEKMLRESQDNSLVPTVRIIDIINSMKSETDCTAIPSVTLISNGKDVDFLLNGCAIFQKDETFSSYLSQEASEGLAFLNDKIKKGYLSAEIPNGGRISLVINKGSVRYKISEKEGVPSIKLFVNLSCDLEEVEGADYFSVDYDFMEKLKNSAEKEVVKKTENTFMVLKNNHYGDIIRFGKRIKLKNSKLYNEYKKDSQISFRKIKCSASAKVTIRRIGEETFHSNKR